MNKAEALKKCHLLFEELSKLKVIKEQNKFSLSADKLDEVIVLDNILSMEEARQPLFAKKPTGGNSNNQMIKWRKKEKGGDKDQ